jgi:hypothetical protein
MNPKYTSGTKATRIIVFFMALALFTITPTNAQTKESSTEEEKPARTEKAEQILQRALEALGGSVYQNVRTLTARGYYTPYKEGVSTLPISFVDYIAYPDRERTEFRGRGIKVVQTNVRDTGWVWDGEAQTLKDMKKEQIEDFQGAMRRSLEYLLRGWWRKEGAKLSYVGRREAGVGRRNETVRLVYTDGLSVEYEFAAQDGLPAKVLYQRKNAEGDEALEEDRFAQHVKIDGVTVPFVVDHYRAGVQVSRINYQSVELNRTLADSLFARPSNAKALK